MNKKISFTLLNWYFKNNYNFPWRKSNDAYSIWISEIMLQQTQVKTVIPYYNNWMNSFPNVEELSKSTLTKVLKNWEGLGYYKRAENIYKTSQILSRNNFMIPISYKELLKLPGIGDYTASAILSIAYNKKYASIDGNLKRVLTRLFKISKNKQTIKSFKNYANKLLCIKQYGDINQSLMDLGREICLPLKPNCIKCPINKFCKAYIDNDVANYSVLTVKKSIPTFNVVVSMIFKKNKFIIAKRASTGLLANLWELPGGKIIEGETRKKAINREIKEELNITIKSLHSIGAIKHQYSHFKVNIMLFLSEYNKGQLTAVTSQDIKWIAINQINNYTFPKATHKLFNLYRKYVKNNL